MTLTQLRIFLKVAEMQHVTRAAEALNMTQSAVSAAISALERNHGVFLFNRIGRRIDLTTEGTRFLPEAQQVVRQADKAERMLSDIVGEPSGPLRLVASQTVASHWLPPYLVRFHDQHPKVDITLTSTNTVTAVASVRDGAADIGMVEGIVSESNIHCEAIDHDALAAVVGPQHQWTDGRAVSTADILRTAWVGRERGSGARERFEQLLSARGLGVVDLPGFLEMPSNEACLAALSSNTRAALISRRAIEPHLTAGNVRLANLPEIKLEFLILTHAWRHKFLGLESFLSTLRTGPTPGIG